MEFTIENGVLIKYSGNETECIIPEGVTDIEREANLKSNDNLRSLIIPPSVKLLKGYRVLSDSYVENVEIWGKLETIEANFEGAMHIKNIIITDQLKRTKKLSQFMRHSSRSYNITVFSSSTGKIKCVVPMHSDDSDIMRNNLEDSWRKDNTFDYKFLDNRFNSIKVMEPKVNIALTRISYPFELTDEQRTMYMDYLKKNAKILLLSCIKENDYELFVYFCELGFINKSNKKALLDYAINNDKVPFTAYLLEKDKGINKDKREIKALDGIRCFRQDMYGQHLFSIYKYDIKCRY